MRYFACLILLSKIAHAEPIYEIYMDDLKDMIPDTDRNIARIQSPYLAVLDACFKNDLYGFNIRKADFDMQWKESLICYDDQNFKLSKELKVNFKECEDKRANGTRYEQANCMQSEIIKAHNIYKPQISNP